MRKTPFDGFSNSDSDILKPRWLPTMDTEDGVVWVYGVGGDGVLAFTDFGI